MHVLLNIIYLAANILIDILSPNIKQTLTESVESILESLLGEELKMNNLPYDNINDLIKGLQVGFIADDSEMGKILNFYLTGAYREAG